MLDTAEQHKQRGNQFFSGGDYEDAIQEYTKAIIKDSSNPIYFQNRALCYYRTGSYDRTEQDARRAIDLDPSSLKGHYYLGLALLELRHLTQADSHLAKAYALALQTRSKSAASIAESVLECRRAQWDRDERQRTKRSVPLLDEILTGFEKARAARVAALQELPLADRNDELAYIDQEFRQKVSDTKKVFAAEQRVAEMPPDYLTDPISFNLFVDPVVTKSGRSYERAWLEQHLKTSATDPFSREALREDEIYPNLQLKAAAEDFIKRNGVF